MTGAEVRVEDIIEGERSPLLLMAVALNLRVAPPERPDEASTRNEEPAELHADIRAFGAVQVNLTARERHPDEIVRFRQRYYLGRGAGSIEKKLPGGKGTIAADRRRQIAGINDFRSRRWIE